MSETGNTIMSKRSPYPQGAYTLTDGKIITVIITIKNTILINCYTQDRGYKYPKFLTLPEIYPQIGSNILK